MRGSCPTVTSIQNNIDSWKPLSNDDSDPFSPVRYSTILVIADAKDFSNEKDSKELSNEQEIYKFQEENNVDADNSECDLLKPGARLKRALEVESVANLNQTYCLRLI